jgi:dephospho-CoA kinase
MIILGLTGSIGMGKTTAAKMLRDIGVPVHCSDDAVHDALNKGGKAVSAVSQAFPAAYDKKSDSIDRKKLGKIVFEDDKKRAALEAILHPLVRESQDAFIKEQKKHGTSIVCLDIPLLYETGAEARTDYVMVVSAPKAVQKQRVLARPDMTEDKFEAILKTQLSDKEKRKRADFVIPTGVGMDHTRQHLTDTINKLKGGPPKKYESNRFPTHEF